MLQNPLNHSAAIRMRGQSKHLPLKRIDDELQRLGLHTFDALLHHVIAILVFHTLEDVAIQFPNHFILLV